MITHYVFTVLHDADETFSGMTQFVYADVFELACDGYIPGSPLHEQIKEKVNNTSSSDWDSKQRSTWSAEFR